MKFLSIRLHPAVESFILRTSLVAQSKSPYRSHRFCSRSRSRHYLDCSLLDFQEHFQRLLFNIRVRRHNRHGVRIARLGCQADCMRFESNYLRI